MRTEKGRPCLVSDCTGLNPTITVRFDILTINQSINQSIYWRNETVYMTSVNKQSKTKSADEVCTNKCPNKKNTFPLPELFKRHRILATIDKRRSQAKTLYVDGTVFCFSLSPVRLVAPCKIFIAALASSSHSLTGCFFSLHVKERSQVK